MLSSRFWKGDKTDRDVSKMPLPPSRKGDIELSISRNDGHEKESNQHQQDGVANQLPLFKGGRGISANTVRQTPWQKMQQGARERFDRISHGYTVLLRFVLKHRLTALLATAVLFGCSLLFVPGIGTEFLPPSDEGEVRVSGEMEVGTRLPLVDKQTRLMEKIVYPAVPEAVSTVVSVRENEGEIRMSLTPAAQRRRSNTDIADDLRRRLDGKIPGMKIRTRAPQGQFLLERLFRGAENVNVEIRGFDLATLHALSEQVVKQIDGIEGITD
ncbi:MAG: efflux RND transporter permease subunit, partial [Deltaproteobacteria bacterium]|nr:efflux RND transporter permease subunit [Deltaproteobacteria bacterium]